MEVSSARAASKVLKFFALALLCAFAVLTADYYFAFSQELSSLSKNLTITLFLKNSADESGIAADLESFDFARFVEYIDSAKAYEKAVEKNPFLKDVSVPGDTDSFQGYAVFVPSDIPTQDYLIFLKEELLNLKDADEVVFDPAVFEKYAEGLNVLRFYKSAGAIFALAVLFFFIVRSAFFLLSKEGKFLKLALQFGAYLLCAAGGFLILWSVCLFLNRELLISQYAVFAVIPIIAAIGIILKD